MIHTVKGFSIVNEKEVDVFLEFSCFFYDPMDVGNLISGSSAFSKSNLNIWKFLVHVLKPSLIFFYGFAFLLWKQNHKKVYKKKYYKITFVINKQSNYQIL